jgi:hypothetical protein
MAGRLLTIMGSGETAPTMIKVHREVFDRLDRAEPSAVLLDTPSGFQANADIISERTVEYFRQSVGRHVEVAQLRRTDTGDRVAIEQALARLRSADWLFTGPGSPSFALRQWAGTPVPGVLADLLDPDGTGGALVFSSAAALTLGVVTVPVYEIYKVGADPFWLDGLDLLSALGLPVAVIPHFDNTEGGNHDTRFCYLGLPRLEQMERALPDGAFVLGVDEHTGVILDLDADTATILGRGAVTLRQQGRQRAIEAGQTVALDVLRAGVPAGAASAATAGGTRRTDATRSEHSSVGVAGSLAESTRTAEAEFRAAMAAGDVDGAVAAVLALDDAITAWSADTLQSDEMDRARAARRAMVVQLGQAAAAGLRDPRVAVAPVVEAALSLRAAVRAERRYDLSDLLRDELAAAGIEVRDTGAGVEWELRGGS